VNGKHRKEDDPPMAEIPVANFEAIASKIEAELKPKPKAVKVFQCPQCYVEAKTLYCIIARNLGL